MMTGDEGERTVVVQVREHALFLDAPFSDLKAQCLPRQAWAKHIRK
jgi:hypothetical protein